jgi:hypothetical protein
VRLLAQKAGFCLADERYEHALAFISRAEDAFLRSVSAWFECARADV